MSKYEGLEKAMCEELEALERKMHGGGDMTIQDLEKVDKLTHALKCLATYEAMKEAEEYEMDGMSGRRGRAANGRYVSRSPGNYEDGYSRGYSEAMSRMPHYPDRNW